MKPSSARWGSRLVISLFPTHSVRPQRRPESRSYREAQGRSKPGPPPFDGDHKPLRLDVSCGVVQHAVPFAEGFSDQGDLALLQVPDSAVEEFGAARRGALGKVVRSMSRVESPLEAASKAMPSPVAPPPMMHTSHCTSSRRRAIMDGRCSFMEQRTAYGRQFSGLRPRSNAGAYGPLPG